MPDLPNSRLSPILCLLLLVVAAGCRSEENAIARGDRMWADSDYTGAVAEYKLAVDRRAGDAAARARLAHAYAVTGHLAPARDEYGKLVAADSQYAAQAAFDYLTLARQAEARGDRYGVAAAAAAAAAVRPGLAPADFAPVLARYYATNGEPERAIAYYREAASSAPPDSAAQYTYELALLEEQRGSYDVAQAHYRDYLDRAPTGPRAEEARWHIGNCAFELAKRDEAAGYVDDALAELDTVTQLGVPQNLQDQAWFRRGEILLGLGRRYEALSAYQMVLELNPARTGQLVQRAQQRIDQIRFGG